MATKAFTIWISLALLTLAKADTATADVHGVAPGGVGCSGTVDCNATIEAGISAASAGDTVRILPGTYVPLGSGDAGNLHGRIGIGDTDSFLCPFIPTLGAVSIRIPADKSPLVVEGDPAGARPLIDVGGKPVNTGDRTVFGVIAPDVTVRHLEFAGALVAVAAGCEDPDADCECGPGTCSGDGVTPCRIDDDCSGTGGTCDVAGRPLGRADRLTVADCVAVMDGSLFGGDVSLLYANAITLGAGFPGSGGVVNLSDINIIDNTVSAVPPACNAIRFRAGAHSGHVVSGNTISDYEDAIISNAFGGCGSICANSGLDVRGNEITTPASDPGCFFEGAIYFKGTHTSTIADNVIIDGGGAVQAAIQLSGSAEVSNITVTIEGNSVTGSGGIDSGIRLNQDFDSDPFTASALTCNSVVGLTTGIEVTQTAETNDLTLSMNRIATNGTGVLLDGGDAVLDDNLIFGNTVGLDGLSATNTPIDATGNWWGAADGPSPPGSGDPVAGSVTVSPFLTAPDDFDGDGLHDVCDDSDLPLTLTNATAWPARSKPGRIRTKGTFSTGAVPGDSFDVSAGLTLTVTDGLDMLEVGVLAAADCTTKPNGKIKCRTPDKRVKATFIPSKKVPGEFKFKTFMKERSFTKPQAGPLTLVITHGIIDRAGSDGNCVDHAAKLACKSP